MPKKLKRTKVKGLIKFRNFIKRDKRVKSLHSKLVKLESKINQFKRSKRIAEKKAIKKWKRKRIC